MKTKIFLAFLLLALAGCGTYSTPAAVQISDGRQMVGTATAAASGGTFHVTDGRGFSCDGTYDAFDSGRVISAPVLCSDGKIGTITIQRTPDLMSGTGEFVLNDGTHGRVAFGKLAPTVLTQLTKTSVQRGQPAALLGGNASSSYHTYFRGPRGGCYYITGSGRKEYVARNLCN